MSQNPKLPYGLMAELGRVPKGRPPPVHLWEPENRYAIDLFAFKLEDLATFLESNRAYTTTAKQNAQRAHCWYWRL